MIARSLRRNEKADYLKLMKKVLGAMSKKSKSLRKSMKGNEGKTVPSIPVKR